MASSTLFQPIGFLLELLSSSANNVRKLTLDHATNTRVRDAEEIGLFGSSLARCRSRLIHNADIYPILNFDSCALVANLEGGLNITVHKLRLAQPKNLL